LAEKKGFDPLVAENWQNITAKEIEDAGVRIVLHRLRWPQLNVAQGVGMVRRYKKNFREGIRLAFPELNFDSAWLQGLNTNWKDDGSLRAFFVQLANIKGFDPLDAVNWTRITQRDIIAAGVWLGFLFACF
jgi:hypothetical protein